MTDFYVINSSEQSISIEYKVKDFSLSGPFVSNPHIIVMTKNINHSGDKNFDTVILNIEDKMITCKLNPGEALWFGDDLNFSLNNHSDQEKLQSKIEYLKITTSQGVLMANESNIVSSLSEFERQQVGIEIN